MTGLNARLTGQLTAEEAERLALEGVGRLRYEDSGYFWVNDLEGRFVMHPTKPEVEEP